jgi:hypothetical protein
MRLDDRDSIPGEHREFYLLYKVQTSSAAYSVVYPEFEVDLSLYFMQRTPLQVIHPYKP